VGPQVFLPPGAGLLLEQVSVCGETVHRLLLTQSSPQHVHTSPVPTLGGQLGQRSGSVQGRLGQPGNSSR